MKNAKGILLSLSLIILIAAFGLAPFTGAIGGNVTSGNATDSEWVNISVGNMKDVPLFAPLGDSPATWTVHPTDPSANFQTIQSAIDNSSVATGDSIEVWNGTYNENVVVDKRLTIYSMDGANVTVVDAKGSGSSITITADGCTVDGFKATGGAGPHSPRPGIKVESNGNIIKNNICEINGKGIELTYSSSNTISNNEVSENDDFGIHIDTDSSNNVMYFNDFINNSGENADSFESDTIWNSSPKITYTYNGSQYTNYTGNYWSDYLEADNNSDGIGGVPYDIYEPLDKGAEDDYDYYPLIQPLNEPPVVNFTFSPSKPFVNESVTFNASLSYDPDGVIISYKWDLGDGNITNTNESIITHSYRSAGDYIVKLTVTDNASTTNSTSKVITILPSLIFPVHNLNTSENFSTIQDAIYAFNTTNGHIIEVKPGTYNENVEVNKSLIIRSTSGNPADTIILAANSNDHVFDIFADYVNISGFTIKGATGDYVAGIYISSSNNTITNNILTSNCYGIMSPLFVAITNQTFNRYSDDELFGNNTMSNNNISFNKWSDISLTWSNDNTISKNYVNSNEVGIHLSDSSNYNTITNNFVCSNKEYGLELYGDNNIIANNNLSYNEYGGIYAFDADNNLIANNTANFNFIGLQSWWGWYNNITNNNFDYNNYSGIELWDSSDYNNITNNSANFNYAGGMVIIDSSSNRIENNNFSYIQLWGGILLLGNSNNNKINNNVANSNGAVGIALFQSSSNNKITNNNVCFNKHSGIQITDSAGYNSIINNYASFNNVNGILLWKLRYFNNITNNNASNNNLFGILVLNSTNISISKNTANLNERGIGLNESSEIQLINNVAKANEISGLSLINSTNNIIFKNSARFNTYEGIYLSNSSLNNITNNVAESNSLDGIYLTNSSSNVIYRNDFVNNSINVYSDESDNIWNSLSKITYTYNGSQYTNYMGNYWSDYFEADNNSDGIGDVPYDIYEPFKGAEDDYDYYPLIQPFKFYFVNEPPVADFIFSPTEPFVNESVTFNASSSYDPDGFITKYEWDFGDENITNTNENIITHSYRSAEDFTVKLTVTDNASTTKSTSKVITIRPLIFPVHNLNTSENFFTIQEAIYAVNTTDGHIIEVDPGTYNENVKVNKSLTICSTSGNPADTIIQAANSNDHVFNIFADYVNISGFTVKGATGNDRIGVSISSANNTITNNILTSNCYGLFLRSPAILYGYSVTNTESRMKNVVKQSLGGMPMPKQPEPSPSVLSSNPNKYSENNNTISNSNISYFMPLLFPPVGGFGNNTISNNNISFNERVGIHLISSNNNTINNNNISFNEWSGISLTWSNNNTISNNYANSNGVGIHLYSSNYNTITNNNLSFNENSIVLNYLCDNNAITNNRACLNKHTSIDLYLSNSNNLSNNFVCSNEYGLYLHGADNIITNNNLSCNEYSGIYAFDADHNTIDSNIANFNFIGLQSWWGGFNNITNNNVSNNNLFGIFVLNSTNILISNNTANLNERGIGLNESCEIQLINNVANSNEISGFSLINSTHNTIFNNSACFNTYEGIYLSNSSLNNISKNNVSGSPDSRSYFGISLYSSKDNDIISNIAESNYYFKVFLYSSTGNNIVNFTQEDIYNQTDIIRGVRLYILESLTPSLQSVENSTNATYYVIVENLGNVPDTFDLVISSIDNPEILSLDKNNVSLGAGEISINITASEVEVPQTKVKVAKIDIETIKLNVSDTNPGIYRAKVEAISRYDDTVKDVIETWTIVQGEVDSAPINSTIINSALINSSLNDSTINRSAIINSIISDSTITDSIINNSEVDGTSLSDVILDNAIVNIGNISSGNITINDIKYEINNETRISDLVIGSDYRDSNLVGIKYIKTLNVYAENSNTSFNISAKDDYFAGSMSVQKSLIPPNGIPEFINNVGGYVYANASDNLANSTGWLIIKVFYEQNELGELNESSLKLRYFNETADPQGWEDIPISGVNLIEKYVWGNVSHYSVFALIAQPAVPPPPPFALIAQPPTYAAGGGRPLPEEVRILIANPGINIFHFEWLGLDITEVLTELKSMEIDARVKVKKIDKPAEIPDPLGIGYGYFEITTNIERENIKSAAVNFRVGKSWSDTNDISVATIKMCRYANAKGWEELETEKIKEDEDYLYFSAETPGPGLSLFVITGEKKIEFALPTPAPTPTSYPTALPTPSPTPIPPAPISVITWFIIMAAIVASAVILIVLVFFYWYRRR